MLPALILIENYVFQLKNCNSSFQTLFSNHLMILIFHFVKLLIHLLLLTLSFGRINSLFSHKHASLGFE